MWKLARRCPCGSLFDKHQSRTTMDSHTCRQPLSVWCTMWAVRVCAYCWIAANSVITNAEIIFYTWNKIKLNMDLICSTSFCHTRIHVHPHTYNIHAYMDGLCIQHHACTYANILSRRKKNVWKKWKKQACLWKEHIYDKRNWWSRSNQRSCLCRSKEYTNKWLKYVCFELLHSLQISCLHKFPSELFFVPKKIKNSIADLPLTPAPHAMQW